MARLFRILVAVGFVLAVAGCADEEQSGDDDAIGDDDSADPCDLDTDGDGFDDCIDPTPFGYAGPSDREAPLSIQMHLHGSLSEGDGTMAYYTSEAAQYGIDVLWWSDHDSMILMLDRQGGYDFDGGALLDEVEISGSTAEHGMYLVATGLDDFQSQVIEGGPNGSGYCWHLAGQAADAAGWSRASYNYDADAFMHHVPLLAGATASIDVRPYQDLGSDWELRFSFELSKNLDDTTNHIVYFVGGADLSNETTADSLYLPVDESLEQDQWTTLEFPLSVDAEHFFEQTDQGAHGYLLQLGARNHQQVAVDLDNFVLSWEVDGEELLQRQRDILAERYSDAGVIQYVGYEMTPITAGRHVNPLVVDPPLYSYPPLDLIELPEAVSYVHELGGTAMCNHPFGAGAGPLPDVETQDLMVADLLDGRWLPNDAYGCDAIEIYPRRMVDLEHYLIFWDQLASHAFLITGVGTSDQHGARDWSTNAAPYVTWVFLDVPSREAIMDDVQRGRAFFGDPYPFVGQQASIDLWSEHGAVMGQVVVGDLDHVIHVEVGYVEPGWELALVVDGITVETTILDGSEQEVVCDVARSDAEVQTIRAELRDLDGTSILMSNPIYLVAEGTAVAEDRLAY